MSYARAGLLVSLRGWFAAPLSAESLMERYATQGDEKALSALYDQHTNRLYYYLLVMTDADTAADVAQKTWLKVIEKKHLYQAQGKFEAWLFTLGRHTLLDELRRQRRYQHDSSALDHIAGPPPTAQTDGDFHQWLRHLPFEQKEAFSLQQEGFSLSDISRICNVPQETVKTRLRYAREKLKKALESQS